MDNLTNEERAALVAQQLAGNPHVEKMVDIFASEPELLRRLESGDMSVITQVSENAKDYFLLLALEVAHGQTERGRLLRDTMTSHVYNKLRATDTID
jgi:hypothetical protein